VNRKKLTPDQQSRAILFAVLISKITTLFSALHFQFIFIWIALFIITRHFKATLQKMHEYTLQFRVI